MKSFMKVFAAGAAVTVAAFGAKAEALTVDRDMTLDANYSGKSGYELPLAFVDTVTTGSLGGWEVSVNGELKSNYGLAWQNGKLVVPRTGLMVYVK